VSRREDIYINHRNSICTATGEGLLFVHQVESAALLPCCTLVPAALLQDAVAAHEPEYPGHEGAFLSP
jgi:hypothetical protein